MNLLKRIFALLLVGVEKEERAAEKNDDGGSDGAGEYYDLSLTMMRNLIFSLSPNQFSRSHN